MGVWMDMCLSEKMSQKFLVSQNVSSVCLTQREHIFTAVTDVCRDLRYCG